jgi:hypothetical protein
MERPSATRVLRSARRRRVSQFQLSGEIAKYSNHTKFGSKKFPELKPCFWVGNLRRGLRAQDRKRCGQWQRPEGCVMARKANGLFRSPFFSVDGVLAPPKIQAEQHSA